MLHNHSSFLVYVIIAKNTLTDTKLDIPNTSGQAIDVVEKFSMLEFRVFISIFIFILFTKLLVSLIYDFKKC